MSVVLAAWRRYLVRRRYAPETVWARVSLARRWTAAVPHWRTADYRELEAWIDQMGVSARSARNAVSHLRAFYRWAMREGYTDNDPTALVETPRLPRLLPRPAADDAIGEVLAAATPELAAMIGLMAGGGLRCCEVARLNWADVNLEQSAVIVRGKGSRERRIELGDDVVRRLAALNTYDGAVFVTVTGRRYTPARVSQTVCGAFRAAGYGIVAHQLRHRAATECLQRAGGDLEAVRDFLGHASVATTEGYAAVIPGRAAAASRAIRLPA
jgi:site-specific recombinase XerD